MVAGAADEAQPVVEAGAVERGAADVAVPADRVDESVEPVADELEAGRGQLDQLPLDLADEPHERRWLGARSSRVGSFSAKAMAPRSSESDVSITGRSAASVNRSERPH